MSVSHRLITAEEFWMNYGDKGCYELVRGEVIEHVPSGGKHGIIVARLCALLTFWIGGGTSGIVGVGSGFRLRQNPDVVRYPDVYFVRAESVPPSGIPDAFWKIAPDLIGEVVSPGETAGEVSEKVRDFLAAGTRLVWTVYPNTRQVIAHTPDGLTRTCAGTDELTFPDLLPGFSCIVEEIFQ